MGGAGGPGVPLWMRTGARTTADGSGQEHIRVGSTRKSVHMMASARRCANGPFGAAGPPGRARPMVVSPPEATFPSVQRDAPLAHLVRGGNFERRPRLSLSPSLFSTSYAARACACLLTLLVAHADFRPPPSAFFRGGERCGALDALARLGPRRTLIKTQISCVQPELQLSCFDPDNGVYRRFYFRQYLSALRCVAACSSQPWNVIRN